MKYDLAIELINVGCDKDIARDIANMLSGVISKPGLLSKIIVEETDNGKKDLFVHVSGNGLNGDISIKWYGGFQKPSVDIDIEHIEGNRRAILKYMDNYILRVTIVNDDGAYVFNCDSPNSESHDFVSMRYYDAESLDYIKSKGWTPEKNPDATFTPEYSPMVYIDQIFARHGIVADDQEEVDAKEFFTSCQPSVGAYLLFGDWTQVSFKNIGSHFQKH